MFDRNILVAFHFPYTILVFKLFLFKIFFIPILLGAIFNRSIKVASNITYTLT